MEKLIPPYLRRFLLPGISFVLLLAISFRYENMWLSYEAVLVAAPYILLVICAGIALYLMQYTYLYTALLLGVYFAAIQFHLQVSLTEPSVYLVFLVANLLFPLSLMATVMWGRMMLAARTSMVLVAFFSLILWLPFLLGLFDASAILGSIPSQLLQPILATRSLGVLQLLTAFPVLCFLVLIYVLNPTQLSAFWIVCLLAVTVVFAFFAVPLISSLVFCVLAALLLIALFQEAFLLAFVDELTGVPGRKALEKQMLGLGRRYSIAMLDVDYFKKFNDTHGHDVGDQVLRMVAAKINQVGGGGKAYRYGGEEFTIVFSGRTKAQSAPFLEEVRQSIEDYTMWIRESGRPKSDKLGREQRQGGKGKAVKVTISIGVADNASGLDKPERVIKAADKSLYAAKNAGRNCVAVAR